MTTPVEQELRDAVRVLDPSSDDVARQRARFDEARQAVPRPMRRWRRPRRAVLVVIAATAAAAFVAAALLPSGGDDGHDSSPRGGLRLVKATAGGAFGGLRLEDASAAQVLDAAGRAAADGTPQPGPDDWTYVRTTTFGDTGYASTSDRWTSPDGERSFFILENTVSDPAIGEVGTTHAIHYEHLRGGTIGDVAWTPSDHGTLVRQAMWSTDPGDGNASIERIVEIGDRLHDVESARDVGALLDEVIDDAGLTFRNGFACEENGTCGGSGLIPSTPNGTLTQAQSRRLFEVGELVGVMMQTVLPAAATRASYEYLAQVPEMSTAPADDDSGDVILSLTVNGPSYETHRVEGRGQGAHYESRIVPGTTHNTKAIARIDGRTGRLVEVDPKPGVGDNGIRYDRIGLTSGPGIGGELCGRYADACAELRDLAKRLQRDPEARFRGVVEPAVLEEECGHIRPDFDARPTQRQLDAISARHDACVSGVYEAAAARGD